MIGAIARVVFGEFGAEEEVLEEGEGAVGDVFIEGHAAFEGGTAQDTGG